MSFAAKLVTAFILFGTISTAKAAAPHPLCWQKILEVSPYLPSSPEALDCITADSDARVAISELCSSDLSKLSKQFETYTEFRSEHAKTARELRTTLDPVQKTMLITKMLNIEQDWMVLGYRQEVDRARYVISNAGYSCAKR